MDTILKDKKAICVFVLPALFIFILIIVVPIFYSLYYSLLEWNGMSKGIFIGFRNYITLFTNQTDGFIKAIINSFKLAGLSVGVQLPIALLLAIILASNVKGENFYRTVYFIPVIISTVIIGQLWMKIYHPTYGLLNVVLDAIGLGGLKNQWLGKKETALGAVFVPMIWQYIGYHMLLFYSAIKSIPKEFFEAAKVDGASGWKTARYITIPLIMPMIKVCVTFAIIGSLKSFD
jgi:raffinose/stachyose/melibiose transport system permease protein